MNRVGIALTHAGSRRALLWRRVMKRCRSRDRSGFAPCRCANKAVGTTRLMARVVPQSGPFGPSGASVRRGSDEAKAACKSTSSISSGRATEAGCAGRACVQAGKERQELVARPQRPRWRGAERRLWRQRRRRYRRRGARRQGVVSGASARDLTTCCRFPAPCGPSGAAVDRERRVPWP